MSRAGKSSKGTRKAARNQLQLVEILDLTAAPPLAQSFLAQRGGELSVDASRVRRVGAQCLQVLVAAAATWKADGAHLRVINPTEEFLEGCRLLGVHFNHEVVAAEPAR
jgi:chemotaxis protein CheX